ncbi:class I SAM-dependent methyltransferase [Loigolactobacillus backii]|uniref:class I SAM-dependent methyltransferase n=1 Tax=Loigolactobacillus backii TaxID=375175 RepID=UPI001F1A6529|nr:class I SAM-dependent methyltransferase [Loigolactobacillus backii]
MWQNLLAELPKTPQHIIDIGCGTGTLTNEIARAGHQVVGIDQSANMIKQARAKFPQLDLQIKNVLLPVMQTERYDVVFSNAVFHWIKDQDKLLQNIFTLLKANGQLICEFGAAGNIARIQQAFQHELTQLDREYHSPFFFPTRLDYATLLRSHQFKVEEITVYDRPTVLAGGAAGLKNWIEQFFATDLFKLSQAKQTLIIHNMVQNLKDSLWKQDHWEADYRHIKVRASK